MDRRRFLRALGIGAAVSVAPALIVPERRIWQVGATLGGGRNTLNDEPPWVRDEGIIHVVGSSPEDVEAQMRTLERIESDLKMPTDEQIELIRRGTLDMIRNWQTDAERRMEIQLLTGGE